MSARRLPTLLATVVITCGALVAAAGTAAAESGVRYVALGDSFVSVGTLTKLTGPLGCARSTDNYPSGIAAGLEVDEFVDASCGGATTVHMTQPQATPFGTNPPQFDSLTPDTDLVTVSIGGNDIGFGEIVLACGAASLTNPLGAPCQQQYGDSLTERIAAAATKIDAVLDGISERAPDADVVVVGYLRVLPPAGGCWPLVPIAVGDVPYLDGVQGEMNAMLGDRAAAHEAAFVNPDETGHDVCQLPGTKWVEGLIPTSLSAPVHPNAVGQAHVAERVVAAVR